MPRRKVEHLRLIVLVGVVVGIFHHREGIAGGDAYRRDVMFATIIYCYRWQGTGIVLPGTFLLRQIVHGGIYTDGIAVGTVATCHSKHKGKKKESGRRNLNYGLSHKQICRKISAKISKV